MKQRTVRLAATSARIAVGALVAVGCVVGVGAAVAAPWPQVRNEPATTSITPVPGNTTLVCNGSFRALGRDATRADLMMSAAAPRLRVDSPDGEPDTAALKMPDLDGGAGASAITGTVHERSAPLLSAAESVDLDEADLRGLAAAPCREATMSTWLVGGDVSTGASDVLLLSNPGDVPATVDLTVYGLQMKTSTTVVPPGTQVGLALASVAAGEERPVIEVHAEGAPVRASLQSALTRTLDPVGIDMQDGMSGPQTRVDIVGVRAIPVVSGDDSTGIVLRMLSPEAGTQATVRVRAIGSDAVIDEYAIDLTESVPSEVALTGLKDGAYDIEITADEPLVAAARQTARAGAREDFSWMLPAPQLAGRTMFSVPKGPTATLYLRNTEETPATVTIEGREPREIALAAGASAAVRLPAGGYTLKTDAPVRAAIGMRGGEESAAIAGWPLWAPPATQQAIVVRP